MNLEQLRARYGDLQNQIDSVTAAAEAREGGLTAEDYETIKGLLDQQDAVKAQIETAERMEAQATQSATTVPAAPDGSAIQVQGLAAEAEAYSLGEYLQDIHRIAKANKNGSSLELPRVAVYQKKVMAEIKKTFKNAPTGSNEGIGSEGGFLVGEDMVAGIWNRVYNNNQVISRCTQRTISSGANSMKVNGFDESSRADGSRHGGIRGYWLAEAAEKTASRPKWRQMEFILKKLAVLYYATDELLLDATFLQQEVEDAVTDELAFKVQDALVNGNGAGKPLGILTSPALVSQAKETGQTAATIVYNNITKMWSRRWAGQASDYVWLTNTDTFPELANLNLAVGTGGAPAFMPANGLAGQPFNTLMGRPIIEIEQCPTLGTVGDIILADLSQYAIAEKGGIQAAMSIHVQFIYDETVFRWVVRIDGMPLWNSALTPFKGSSTKSAFVALATRS